MNTKNYLEFDISSILEKAKNMPKPKVKSASLNLPFLSIEFTASNQEKKIAKEVLIQLRYKRILVAWECCDSCVKNALSSLQDIRVLLVSKQVELANDNSVLFLLFDMMLKGVLQFFTYVEKLETESQIDTHLSSEELHIQMFSLHRTEYLGALEALRGHLLRCIEEVAKVGNTKPNLSNKLQFNPNWDDETYIS